MKQSLHAWSIVITSVVIFCHVDQVAFCSEEQIISVDNYIINVYRLVALLVVPTYIYEGGNLKHKYLYCEIPWRN